MPATILCCDDSPDVLDFLCMVLNHAGYTTLGAKNGAELARCLERQRPDLILLDVCLPDSDGFFIADQLKQAGAQIPIVFLSGYDRRMNRLYASVVMSGQYMTKPIDPADLLRTVESALKPVHQPELAIAGPVDPWGND